jgi:outer membrane cobalamin receptor
LRQQNLIKYLTFYFFLFILFPSFGLTQIVEDSISTENVIAQDTSFTEKTSPVIPIRSVGSIDKSPAHAVSYSTLIFSDYKYVGNMLEYIPGVFIYTLGSIGQSNGLIINGLNSIGFLSNGVPINDPLAGNFNMHLYPTENIEKIEYLNGTKSFYYGLNNNGGVVNFISKSFKSLKPYSKIRYSESAYEETYFDGMISQNLLSNLNLNGGVQRSSANGMFSNTAYDAWNARAKLRYDISDDLNIYFREIYNQNELQLNGGVDISKTPTDSLYDRLKAAVRNTNSYEKVARNDLQLGAAVKILPDTTSISNINFYLSNQMRRYRDQDLKLNFHSRWMGVKFTQHFEFAAHQQNIGSAISPYDTSLSAESTILQITDSSQVVPTSVGEYRANLETLNQINLDFGFDIQSRQIFQGLPLGYRANTVVSLFAKGEFQPIEKFKVGGYMRNDTYLKKQYLNLGADVHYSIGTGLTLTGGYSESYRLPTFQENYWRDTNILGEINEFNPEKHKLLEVGFNLSWENVIYITTTYFNRNVDGAIIPTPINNGYPNSAFNYTTNEMNLSGINASGEINIWKVKGIFNSTIYIKNNSIASHLPRVNILGELFFRDIFFRDHLDLKFGVRGRAISAQKGFQFNSLTISYLPNSNYDLGAGGSLDAFVFGRIGSAVVHIILENVLDNQYAVTTFYPIQDMSLRFGITWEFEN